MKEQLVTGEVQQTSMHFPRRSEEIFDVDNFLTNQFNELVLRENLNQPKAGTGWNIKRYKETGLKLNKNNSLNAGSYIELPKIIKIKEVL